MNVLILDCTGTDWTDRNLAKLDGVTVNPVYHQVNKILRLIRRGHFCTLIPWKSIWYAEWKRKINEYDVIIIFSALLGDEIFGWIKNKDYNGRLILYYRDPQSAKYMSQWLKAENIKAKYDFVELWSFDEKDALNYGMKYNSQFYFSFPIVNVEIKYDALYIGTARNRNKLIKLCYDELRKHNLKILFIVKVEEKIKFKSDGVTIIRKSIDYEKIIEMNKLTRTIVELNQGGQSGLTVRALEALFMKKKLITNNVDIRNMDFYHVDNIFVIGVDDWGRIDEFINKPYHDIDECILMNYKAGKWLERFFEV